MWNQHVRINKFSASVLRGWQILCHETLLNLHLSCWTPSCHQTCISLMSSCGQRPNLYWLQKIGSLGNWFFLCITNFVLSFFDLYLSSVFYAIHWFSSLILSFYFTFLTLSFYGLAKDTAAGLSAQNIISFYLSHNTVSSDVSEWSAAWLLSEIVTFMRPAAWLIMWRYFRAQI